MKWLRALPRLLLLALLTAFISGCATSRHGEPEAQRFHDAKQADAVLRFASWDYTFLVKPFYAEDGFMQQVHPETLHQVFDRYQTERDLAVVVVGWQYNDDLLGNLVTDWKSILRGCGFERVVILRPQSRERLNGSVIVDDSSVSSDLAQTDY